MHVTMEGNFFLFLPFTFSLSLSFFSWREVEGNKIGCIKEKNLENEEKEREREKGRDREEKERGESFMDVIKPNVSYPLNYTG